MIVPDTGLIYNLLGQLKLDLAQQLNPMIQRSVIMPGSIAWDACDSCGLLAISVSRLFASEDFPLESTSPFLSVASMLGVDVSIQVIRCAPTGGEDGSLPTVAELEATTQLILADATTVFCAASDLFNSWVGSGILLNWVAREQRFVGPEGACVGSEFNVVWGLMR